MSASGDEHVFTADEGDHVPGVLGGPFAPLPFLPGTSTFISPMPLVAVRGQQPSATAYLYDGVRVPTLFHLVAGPTFFPEGAVSRYRLDSSLAPARIRGASGGVLSVSPPDGADRGLHNATSIDLLSVSNTTAWTSLEGTTSVAVGAGALWTPWLYSRVNRSVNAELYSYFGRAETVVGPGRMRLLAFGVNDAFSTRGSTDLLGGGFGVHRIDARFRQPSGAGEFELGATFGVDTVSARLGGSVSEIAAVSDVTTLAVRASRTAMSLGIADLSIGVDADHRSANLETRSNTSAPRIEGSEATEPVVAAVSTAIARATVIGAWAEIGVGAPEFRWTFGGRTDSYVLGTGQQLFAFDPRLHVTRRFSDDLRLDVAVGMTHLPPTHLIPLPPADLAALRFGLQQIVQSSAELSYRIRSDAELSVAVFANVVNRGLEMSPLDRHFLQTVKAEPGSTFAPQITRGHDAGAELMVRPVKTGPIFGWVSYSYLHSRRELRFTTRNDFGEPAGTRIGSVQPNWTQAHAANLVLGRTAGGWTFSGALHLHAGAPEAGGLSSFTQRMGRDRLRPGPRWIEQDLDRVDMLQPYFRADLHVASAFSLGALAMEASLDVQNVTFGREVSRYNYSEQFDSLEDRAAGNVRLQRTSGSSGVPAVPLPMLGLKARY